MSSRNPFETLALFFQIYLQTKKTNLTSRQKTDLNKWNVAEKGPLPPTSLMIDGMLRDWFSYEKSKVPDPDKQVVGAQIKKFLGFCIEHSALPDFNVDNYPAFFATLEGKLELGNSTSSSYIRTGNNNGNFAVDFFYHLRFKELKTIVHRKFDLNDPEDLQHQLMIRLSLDCRISITDQLHIDCRASDCTEIFKTLDYVRPVVSVKVIKPKSHYECLLECQCLPDTDHDQEYLSCPITLWKKQMENINLLDEQIESLTKEEQDTLKDYLSPETFTPLFRKINNQDISYISCRIKEFQKVKTKLKKLLGFDFDWNFKSDFERPKPKRKIVRKRKLKASTGGKRAKRRMNMSQGRKNNPVIIEL